MQNLGADEPLDGAASERAAERLEWRAIRAIFRRPQPVTIPLVALFAIVPFYLFIGGGWVAGRTLYVPELQLDRILPLRPEWSFVYASLFCAALLPAFVLHQQDLIRRTLLAFIAAWLFSYVIFIAFPTIAPARPTIAVHGFSDWGLRTIYDTDVKYNCFPSLHVAQCCLAALACYRVHRGVGAVAGVWAALVATATLYTKQHYVLDVLAGAALAFVLYLVFLRGYPREAIPEMERRLAPVLAVGAFATYGLFVALFRIAYALGVMA